MGDWTPKLSVDAVDVLAEKLVDLNRRAVACRYPDHLVEEVATAIDWKMRFVNMLAAIKAADCWLYQCAEGDEFTDTIVYLQISDLRDRACREYVSFQQEYKDAKTWG
jgi:hypothetical protein